ncbi:hypothetical protein [Pseudoxanthomonas wuyuanensis]|nr:hypothetical protein [Pseudoxanthomonas wuyuanensis]KAF1720118.1 hypothetical protein CSC75_12230 [Pseudoxanthomonas wuyuanensis]
MNAIRLAAAAAGILLAASACRPPQPPPTDEPPKPQTGARATELRDAIQAPIDKAKAAGDTVQEAAERQRAEIDAATQ